MFCNDFNNRRSRLNDNKNIEVKIKFKIVRQISVIDTLEKLRKEIKEKKLVQFKPLKI